MIVRICLQKNSAWLEEKKFDLKFGSVNHCKQGIMSTLMWNFVFDFNLEAININ